MPILTTTKEDKHLFHFIQ